jgi:hypothetical protein
MAPHPSIDDYDSAEDALAAASKMDMRGDWKDAIALYHRIAEQWPERLPYSTECINAINDKQLLSPLEIRDNTRPMTVGDWMATLLILAIPVVNIIMYLVWAFSNSGNVNRKTFCQASLIWFLVLMAGALVFGLLRAAPQS